MSDTQHTQTSDEKRLLELLTKALNDKGRITIRIKSVWIPVIVGLISATLGALGSFAFWVNSGKLDLENQRDSSAMAFEHQRRANVFFTNAIVSLSTDMVSRVHLRVYSDRLERLNTNLAIPDVDQIRTWYPYALPVQR